MKVNLVRDEAGSVVGVAWRLLGRTGVKLRYGIDTRVGSSCACGEQVCDCGCDCGDE